MKERIKKLWLKALRSGQYKQAIGTLTDGKGFCCLGVLCNIHAKETGRTWKEQANGDPKYLSADTVLPYTVRKWAGLKEENPLVDDVRNPGYKADLAEMNDEEASFKTIADAIEKSL